MSAAKRTRGESISAHNLLHPGLPVASTAERRRRSFDHSFGAPPGFVSGPVETPSIAAAVDLSGIPAFRPSDRWAASVARSGVMAKGVSRTSTGRRRKSAARGISKYLISGGAKEDLAPDLRIAAVPRGTPTSIRLFLPSSALSVCRESPFSARCRQAHEVTPTSAFRPLTPYDLVASKVRNGPLTGRSSAPFL